LKISRELERFTESDFPAAASIDEMTVQEISMMAGMISITSTLQEASHRQIMLQRKARQTSQN